MYGMFKFYNVFFTLLMLCVSFKALSESNKSNKSNKITLNQIESIQNEWAKGLINIGAEYEKKGDYRQLALNLINQLYAFNYGNNIVLFKPTKASTHPFRRTKESALSYFVGGNIEEDNGFAIKPWLKIRFSDSKIVISQNTAISMGNYFFTSVNDKKNETKVEYTFGYIKDSKGKLRINLHHSSIPHSKN